MASEILQCDLRELSDLFFQSDVAEPCGALFPDLASPTQESCSTSPAGRLQDPSDFDAPVLTKEASADEAQAEDSQGFPQIEGTGGCMRGADNTT